MCCDPISSAEGFFSFKGKSIPPTLFRSPLCPPPGRVSQRPFQMGSFQKAKSADHAKAVGMMAVFVGAAIAVGAVFFGAPGLATLGGLEELAHVANQPLAATVGGLLSLFLLLLVVTSYFSGRISSLRKEKAGLSRLALVAGKTDQAVFLTDAEGLIEWINEAFTRMSGHMPGDVSGKQPATLLLGTLQNLNVTQRVREGLASQ